MNRWQSKFYVPDLIEPKEKKMSIARCVRCGARVDTAAYPKVYCAEYNDECIYDECWQEFPPDASDIAAVKADFANDAAKCDEL